MLRLAEGGGQAWLCGLYSPCSRAGELGVDQCELSERVARADMLPMHALTNVEL